MLENQALQPTEPKPEPTFGQKLVRLEHRPLTPEEQQEIREFKTKLAELADYVKEKLTPKDPRAAALAITHLQEASIWGTNAITA